MNGLSPGQLAQIACLLEATARKPGNVHPLRHFVDAHYLDFALSATVIGPSLDRARSEGIGVAVLDAVAATRRVVSTNTNLGMILLLAPLAAVPPEVSLAGGIESVLDSTTIDDAAKVYRAIRLAVPGGLGTSSEQDVFSEPTVTLREAMAIAAGRDLVARQYANGYWEVLNEALPELRRSVQSGDPLETAIVATYLHLLANHADSLIVRKWGQSLADEVSRKAAEVLDAGWPGGERAAGRLADFDSFLRHEGRRINPGTTADLTTAALFAALRDGTIPLPRPSGPTVWAMI
jgi:triphosphoribosyl-dephospho-CoA synthase